MYQKAESNPQGSGRKGHWRPEFEEQAYQLAILGATDRQIADFWGITTYVISYWKQQKPAFLAALKKGKTEADMKVAEALYRKAIGFEYEEQLTITNKYGDIIRTETQKKTLAPDAYACLKWLAIRQRETWTEIAKTEHLMKFGGHVDSQIISDAISDPKDYSTEELKLALRVGITEAKKQMPAIN